MTHFGPATRSGALLLGILLALTATPARADDTALNEGAWGPEPLENVAGTESVIRMNAEHLWFVFGKKDSSVKARFIFENKLATGVAKQLVGFPDIGLAEKEADRRYPKHDRGAAYEGDIMGPLRDMQTFVDGVKVPTQIRFGFVASDPTGYCWRAATPKAGGLMAWNAMWVSFPARKPVVVERHYVTASGTNAMGQHLFDYVVGTGGIWHGTIGELVADVTLADGLTVKDLAGNKEAGSVCAPPLATWKVIDATHLQLVWKDFEPRTHAQFGHLELVTKPGVGPDGKPLR